MASRHQQSASVCAPDCGFVHPKEPAPWPERDPADQWVVAAAIEGEAEVLVTGDQDMLEIADKAPLLIVTLRGFWERIR